MFYIYRLIFNLTVFQVACAINQNSPGVINDLMANLKISKINSMDEIGFRMPIDVLKKYSEKNKSLSLNKVTSSQYVKTSQLNSQYLTIHLNKSDFINDVLKNDTVNILPNQLQNTKPSIIEFR